MMLGRRVAAYLVDILILFVVLAPAGFLIQWLLGVPMAQTGPGIERTILWNFSLPAWLYFILSDTSRAGATLGKRLFKLQVRTLDNGRVSFWRALGRTAVKLLPWELVHISAFALSKDLLQLSPVQMGGLVVANLLILVYLGVALVTKGRRSVHDFVAGTVVRLSLLSSRRGP